MKLFKNKRGVALMLVLSAITLITTMAVEFAYDTNINGHLAQNELTRLKAYYLAKSAYNFMILELKFDRVFRQVVQSQNLGQYLGGNVQLPLCQQFPMSTGLIRAVFTGGGLEALTQGGAKGQGAEGEAGADEGEGAEAPVQELRKDATLSDEKSAEEFLQFEGDFDAECIDEGTKIDLNLFSTLNPAAPLESGTNAFDQYRQFLLRFLLKPQFEDLFKVSDIRQQDVVVNLGDWISQNPTAKTKAMGAGYSKDTGPDSIHTGKLMTLMEAYLIDGVIDDWFSPMMDYFTVYGDGKINVCTASPEIVESVIRRYVESTPSLPPMRLEDPKEMEKLTYAVTQTCSSGAVGEQLKSQIAAALNSAITAVSSGSATPPPPAATPGQAPAGQAAGGFADYITADTRFFSLKLTGQVDDVTVRVKAVMDVKEQDPKKWKLLYWRIY